MHWLGARFLGLKRTRHSSCFVVTDLHTIVRGVGDRFGSCS
jgi:hypothetical protein